MTDMIARCSGCKRTVLRDDLTPVDNLPARRPTGINTDHHPAWLCPDCLWLVTVRQERVHRAGSKHRRSLQA